MEIPQLENGYTRIANSLLENLVIYKFNGSQYSIILEIIRCTYGYQKKSHSIALTFLQKATGLSKRAIQKELDILISQNVLIEYATASFKKPRELGINKNFLEWGMCKRIPQVNKCSTGEQLDTSTGEQLDTQKRKSLKKINKEIEEEEEEILKPEKFFQNNFHPITPFIRDGIINWLNDGIEEALILELMKEAVSNNVRNWNYVNKAILNQHQRNILTLEEYISAKNERERLKENQSSPKKNKQMSDEEWQKMQDEIWKQLEEEGYDVKE